jgi:hypothetical protein
MKLSEMKFDFFANFREFAGANLNARTGRGQALHELAA